MKRHDNIMVALSCLVHHERSFALTGGALRRIVIAATGREMRPGFCTTFPRAMKDLGYITSAGQPKVLGHETFVITDKGRAKLDTKETVMPAHLVDPDAWLHDAHRYVRPEAA